MASWRQLPPSTQRISSRKSPHLCSTTAGSGDAPSLPRSSSARRSGRSRALTMSSPIAGSPSRPPRAHLLVVRLDRAGRSQVDHRADVGPVDAHAEGVGRDDDLGAAFGEVGLRALARPSVEAGVIGPRAPAAAGEALRLLLRLLARGRVDDGGAAGPVRRAERLRERGVDEALPLARARHLARRGGPGWGARSRGRSGACRRAGRAAPGSRRARSGSPSPCRRARARPPARRGAPPISRYSGRKSWPHSLMQCASSMATSGHSRSRRSPRKPGKASRSGAT